MLDLRSFEQKIDYRFKDPSLAETALTHRSYAYEHAEEGTVPRTNERLEFLGDAVLELVSSDKLFHMFPDHDEGRLSKMRAFLVCENALSECALKIGLGDFVLLGKGEDRSGGRTRPSILSDTLEAVIGAIYLDGGIIPASEFIHRFVLVNELRMEALRDNKTVLQEILQKENHEPVKYDLTGTSGPEHDRTFTMQVSQGGRVLGSGSGRTKQAAGQAAAADAIKKLKGL